MASVLDQPIASRPVLLLHQIQQKLINLLGFPLLVTHQRAQPFGSSSPFSQLVQVASQFREQEPMAGVPERQDGLHGLHQRAQRSFVYPLMQLTQQGFQKSSELLGVLL